ncbi:GPO family capsid scaffolding protein, partial [Escherichia coli]
MAKKVSKFFRIGVEGDTCDGRVISAQDIQEMAETFDPRVYGCVFRSIRSRIGIEVRSAIRIHSINRELNFFYRFLTRFFAAFH